MCWEQGNFMNVHCPLAKYLSQLAIQTRPIPFGHPSVYSKAAPGPWLLLCSHNTSHSILTIVPCHIVKHFTLFLGHVIDRRTNLEPSEPTSDLDPSGLSPSIPSSLPSECVFVDSLIPQKTSDDPNLPRLGSMTDELSLYGTVPQSKTDH